MTKKVDERIEQFAVLQEVGNLLTSTLEARVVRRRAMEAITGLMGAETGSLLLVDEGTGELFFEVALGEKAKRLKEVRLSAGEGIAGWVAKHGKPALVPDVTSDSRFQGRFDRKSEFTTRNMVCVPVRIRGRTIGVLQAINKLGGEVFTAEDLEVFTLFANHVAIALENARLYEELQGAFYATSAALAEAIEQRDPGTGGHTKRVLDYCLAIGREMKLPPGEMEVLRMTAVLHDIGKIGIEDRILRKEAALDAVEAAAMKRHPEVGAEILKHIPQLKDVIPGLLSHHERVDGLGYPRGVGDEGIPLVAKIVSVADAFDAMTTARPYKKASTPEAALGELQKFSGIQFDVNVVNAFLKAYERGVICANSQEQADAAKVKERVSAPGVRPPDQKTIEAQ